MRTPVRWLLGLSLLAVLAAFLAWAVLPRLGETSKEKEVEGESEAAILAPSRVSRTPAGEVVVTLDAKSQRRIALGTEALTAATAPTEVEAFGSVLDPSPLVALDGELSEAAAALEASRSELDRVRALHDEDANMSLRALEEAQARFGSNENRVRVARRRMALDWGEEIAGLGPADRQALLERLSAFRTVLVRVDLPGGQNLPATPASARIVVAGQEDRPLRATVLAAAPAVNPKVQGQGFLLRVDGADPRLRPGAAVAARLVSRAERRTGVAIPLSAVVRYGGRAWVYVRVAEEQFARREVPLDQPIEAGWFVSEGFAAGDRVVVTGAQALLSEELKSQIEIEA